MKKGEKVSSNTLRKQQASLFWNEVVKEYKVDSVPPPEIAANHINPQTNRPYTTRHIYFILRQMNVL